MGYNNILDRTDAGPLIPEEVANEIWKDVPQASAAMSLFKHSTLSRNQQRVPVVNTLPIAYFVNGDTGLKQTTDMEWANKYFNVEEIACLVPVPDAVAEDADYDIWAEIKPSIVEAIGYALDGAVLFGVNKPATWPSDISAAATSAGNTVTRGTAAQNIGGIATDFSNLFATVEADGYDVNGVIAKNTYKSYLRNARATDGQRLLDVNNDVLGITPQFPAKGAWPSGSGAVTAIVGDFDAGRLGIRKDITFTMHTDGVITDEDGAVIFNAMQQDSKILRAVFRVAFQVKNPVNRSQPTEASRYPFGVMKEA